MFRWLKSTALKDDSRAICAAMILCLFLWSLKIDLVWWMRWSKGIHALADVPAADVPLLGAQDFLFCTALAGLFWVLSLLATPLGKPAHFILGRIVPALVVFSVALFAVVSWKVQQLYGCSLEISHIREATGGLSTMGDSVLAYLTAGTVAFLLAAVVVAMFGGSLLQPLLSRQKWVLVRWRLWAVLVGVALGAYALDKHQMKERYTYGVEQNAVLHFIEWYEPAPKPVDVAELLHDTPKQVVSRDAEFRRFTPFEPMVITHGSARKNTPAIMAPGLPLPGNKSVPNLNVLIILMESTPAMYIDAHAAPNLTRLADGGLRMNHHFTTICETYKAVYSLFFSDYMVDLGSLPRVVYHRQMPQASLAEMLHDDGYATAFYHSGFLRLGDLGYMLKGFDTKVSATELQKTSEPAWRYGVYEEQTVSALSEWIGTHKDKPFFAVYSTMFPHHPYYCPVDDKPFPIDTQVGRYRNALHYTDMNVGHLLDALDRDHLKDNTLVVVMADHGETVSSWPCGHGVNFSMEELHVPLIFSNPQLFPPGSHSDLYTQHPDVAPTILGLIGKKPPAEWLGRNLAATTVPLRAFPVKQEQSKFSGIIDNGLAYRLDEKSARATLLQINGEQFEPVAADDSALALCPAYADRLSLFTPWARWRHYKRVLATSRPTDTSRADIR